MSKVYQSDFRETFAKMAAQAIISRAELASLLSTSMGAISQMAYRGELPATAFPNKRRACWFVGDIRIWLDEFATNRNRLGESAKVEPTFAPKPRIGRPRLPQGRLG